MKHNTLLFEIQVARIQPTNSDHFFGSNFEMTPPAACVNYAGGWGEEGGGKVVSANILMRTQNDAGFLPENEGLFESRAPEGNGARFVYGIHLGRLHFME